MNIQNFKDTYVKTISESANDSDLKNYIRSIVQEVTREALAEDYQDASFILANIINTIDDKNGIRDNMNKLKNLKLDVKKDPDSLYYAKAIRNDLEQFLYDIKQWANLKDK
jgi:hypothetical protein